MGRGELKLLREEGREASEQKMDLVRGDKKVIRVAEETEKERDTGGNGRLKHRRENIDVSLNGCETGEDTMKLLVSDAAFGRRHFNI